jgi:ABC-2 type transport system permease protein
VWKNYVALANTVLPLGWPALCCKQLMAPQFGMPFIAMIGMLTVGAFSFRRSYSTTLRIYTRQEGRSKRASKTRPEAAIRGEHKTNWLERTVPGLPEQVSTVAVASLINLMRAPEAKMALIGPLSMLGVLGAILFGKRKFSIPAGVEGFMLLGSVGIVLFFIAILSFNIFGMDRSSFRALSMMPVRRQDILAGKNLVLLPVFAIMAIPLIVIINLLAPASILCNIATLLQAASILFVIALIGNLMSIYFPMAIANGTAKPVQMNIKVLGSQMLATFAFPLVLLPGMIALGIELALGAFAGIHYLPIYLGLSVAQLVVAQYVYRWQIVRQGEILQSRETTILAALAVHAE